MKTFTKNQCKRYIFLRVILRKREYICFCYAVFKDISLKLVKTPSPREGCDILMAYHAFDNAWRVEKTLRERYVVNEYPPGYSLRERLA